MVKPQVIRSGYYVAISLVPGAAPSNCYIGLVQSADEYGIRIDMVHWDDKVDMVGGHTEGLFVPWSSITSVLVCTEEQPTRRFIRDRAPEWQADVEAMRAAMAGTEAVTVGRAKKTKK